MMSRNLLDYAKWYLYEEDYLGYEEVFDSWINYLINSNN